MELNKIKSKLKDYFLDQIESLSKTDPLISITKPILTRLVDNNINKIDNMLSFLKDDKGNIDIENILSEMVDSVINTKTFTLNTSLLGDINIGDGKIVLTIPYINKNIIFNKQDLEKLKTILID